MTFCDHHQSVSQAKTFAIDANGDKIVVFECFGPRPTASAPLRQPDSGLSYSFRTDQELLNASRDAQVYCLNSGAPEMDSNITVNSDGSKTVTFRCRPR